MKQKSSPSLQNLIDMLIGVNYSTSYEEASPKLIALGDRAIPALRKALDQVSVESQKMPIYMTLMDMKSAAAASVLISRLPKETNPSFQAIIAKGLGVAKCKEAGPILEQALANTEDRELSWSIRVALAHLGEQEEQYRSYLAWLLARADDPSKSTRVEAISTLKTFSSSTASHKLLEKLQTDENSAVKALAALSLTQYNLKSIQKPLEDIVKAGDPEASLFASLALCHIQQTSLPVTVEELKARIKHLPPQGRVAAIRVLSWFYPRASGVEALRLLVDFLLMDNDLSVKQAVVRMIDRFKPVDASKNTSEIIAILQARAQREEEKEIQLLSALALVKLGHLQYLDIIQARLIRAKEYDQSMGGFILFQLDTELHNDIVPFLLNLVDHLPSEEVRSIAEFLLINKYWRDPHLIPYFRECLAGRHRINVLWVAKSLLSYSKEGYEPAYHLLKEFLGEEPSDEAIKRYFFWLSPDSDGPTKAKTD